MQSRTRKAKNVVVQSIPKGMPTEKDFKIEERELPAIKDGELLFESLYVSTDPYQRAILSCEQLKVGDTMCGSTVARVLESKIPEFKKDDLVVVNKGWVTHGILTRDDLKNTRRHDPGQGSPSTALGVLGMTGLTAYFGTLRILNPKPNEVVMVSGAAGAVGSLVGQIAKIHGCRVIGIVSSDKKCDTLKQLGFDHAINYKSCDDIRSVVNKHFPEGIDCYFDTVGGELLDCALRCLRDNARIALCGQSSLSNTEDPKSQQGPRDVLQNLILKNARMEGFVYTRWQNEFNNAITTLSQWIKEGKLKYKETIEEGGLEVTPKAFINMLSGKSIGKQLVKLPVHDPSQ